MYTVRVTLWEGDKEELEVQFPCEDTLDVALSLQALGVAINSGKQPLNSDFVLTDDEKEDLRHAEEVYDA